jgi:hypothetical protein
MLLPGKPGSRKKYRVIEAPKSTGQDSSWRSATSSTLFKV